MRGVGGVGGGVNEERKKDESLFARLMKHNVRDEEINLKTHEN